MEELELLSWVDDFSVLEGEGSGVQVGVGAGVQAGVVLVFLGGGVQTGAGGVHVVLGGAGAGAGAGSPASSAHDHFPYMIPLSWDAKNEKRPSERSMPPGGHPGHCITGEQASIEARRRYIPGLRLTQ